MKISKSSKTADQMALSRAIETRKASHERICSDPFAERFISGKYKLPLFARPLRHGVEKLIELLFAGHHYYVIARTRYFDDLNNQKTQGEAAVGRMRHKVDKWQVILIDRRISFGQI